MASTQECTRSFALIQSVGLEDDSPLWWWHPTCLVARWGQVLASTDQGPVSPACLTVTGLRALHSCNGTVVCILLPPAFHTV